MSITIKSCKNYKKIAKEVKKIFKQQLESKPNSIIGMEWQDDFLKVTNNLKKIIKLDWFSTHIFPLATYIEEQNNPLDKYLVENFINKINIPFSHYEDIRKLAIKYYLENKQNDLFLFDVQGGVDLLVFFIDSRGNFVFNDYESKKTYLNKANNGTDLISIGIKSILNAKKIVCFCIEEASKDVIFKLNRKVIDVDDVLTYLHLHNDVTLFTLNSIINKHEINDEPMTQDKFQFIRELDSVDDFVDVSLLVDKQVSKEVATNQEEDSLNNIENIDLDDFNKNMDNLDDQLLDSTNEEEVKDINDELIDEPSYDEEDQEINYIEDRIEENIFNIKETTEEIENQVSAMESNLENVSEVINNIEQDVELIQESNHLENEKDFSSDFVYLEPSQFDFNNSTEIADKKNEELLMQQIKELQEKLEKIEKEKELILEKAENDLRERLEQEEQKEKERKQLEESNNEDDFNVMDSLLSDEEPNDVWTINSDVDISDEELDSIDITNGLIEEDSKEEEIETTQNKLEEEPKTIVKTKPIGDDIPNSADDIYRYIKIKSETLNHVEKLLLNNKLAKIQFDLIQKHNETDTNEIDKKIANHNAIKFINENKHIIDKNGSALEKYKLTYFSGFRPVPMLMVWHDINKNFYYELLKEMDTNLSIKLDNNVFDQQGIHVWNDGCYLIYDESTLMIRALAFSSLDRLIFLLRYVNKNLSMQFSNKRVYEILLDLFKENVGEIKVERI